MAWPQWERQQYAWQSEVNDGYWEEWHDLLTLHLRGLCHRMFQLGPRQNQRCGPDSTAGVCVPPRYGTTKVAVTKMVIMTSVTFDELVGLSHSQGILSFFYSFILWILIYLRRIFFFFNHWDWFLSHSHINTGSEKEEPELFNLSCNFQFAAHFVYYSERERERESIDMVAYPTRCL